CAFGSNNCLRSRIRINICVGGPFAACHYAHATTYSRRRTAPGFRSHLLGTGGDYASPAASDGGRKNSFARPGFEEPEEGRRGHEPLRAGGTRGNAKKRRGSEVGRNQGFARYSRGHRGGSYS